MLNNQPSSAIHTLAAESHTQDLLSTKLIEELWESVNNEPPATWQHLINQHFPYLPLLYQRRYQVVPKALFIEEFQFINSIIQERPEYTVIKSYLFASLRGDIEKIEKSKICDKVKELLYIYAAANGHVKGLSKLDPVSKGEALKLAAENGFLPACQMILTDVHQQISAENKELALQYAANMEHHEVVQALLAHSGQKSSAEFVGLLLRDVAKNGYHEVVQALLTHAGQQISAEDKGRALINAANGHHEVVQALLAHAGQEISVELKCSAIICATDNKHFDIVKTLLTQVDKGETLQWVVRIREFDVVQALLTLAGQEISAEDKGQALVWTAYSGHLECVQALLTQPGQQISAEHKGQALVWAAQNGQHKVVQALLHHAGQQISVEDKGKALKYAAREEHQDVGSFLLERVGHQLPVSVVIQVMGFFSACKFYAMRTATALGDLFASFAPSTPVEQLPLPPVTTEPLAQPTLPPQTLDLTPKGAKRKQESTLKTSNNKIDDVNDEPFEIKRAKLR